ncbi:hypothetical protein KP509_04G071700 [Ceratopteris richardii]|nr:hypothetical protein KP509_04G071700 [Ceratopteris richardii]
MMQSFFNWFGMAVSSASVLAATMMAYIQDNVSYGVGYLLSLSCISGSFLLVMIASPLLHHKPASGSPIILIYNIFLAAWRNRKIRHPLTRTSDIICCQQKDFDEKIEAIRTNQFLFLDKAALNVNCKQNPDMKDCIEWNISTLQEVEDVKMFLRLLPILATTITFWTCNAQMITFSTQQASTLDRRLGRHFSIPAASLTVFVQLGCLMTLSIYEKLLIPLIRRWRRNEYGVTSLQRIGIGLMLSSSSLLIASLVEKKRLRIAKQFNHSTDAAWLPMSVFYLIPQYWLVGMGDAFGYVGQLEFFYRESPTRMRSLGSGLSLSSISLGFFFSSTLVDVVNRFSRNAANEGWLTNDLNTSRLDNFYLFVASCSILSLLAYLVCSQWYVYRDQWAIHQNKN